MEAIALKPHKVVKLQEAFDESQKGDTGSGHTEGVDPLQVALNLVPRCSSADTRLAVHTAGMAPSLQQEPSLYFW